MAAAFVTTVNESNFERDVIARSAEVPVVIDFWAPWCGPCKTLGPVLERLATEGRGEWVLAKVNADECPNLVQQFAVQGIPAVKAVVGGRVVDEFVGALPEAQVRTWIGRLLPTEADREVARARALEPVDPAAAESAYEKARATDPDHPGALMGLARVQVARGRLKEAAALVERAALRADGGDERELAEVRLAIQAGDAGEVHQWEARLAKDPDDLEARWGLAMSLAVHQDFDAALEHLLDLVRRDRTYRDDGARKAMLDIFEKVGNRSDLAERWREKLARALYS